MHWFDRFKRNIRLKRATAFLFSLVFAGLAMTPPAFAALVLPQSEPTFNGKIGITYKESQPDTSLLKAIKAPAGAPNVLLVLIDDAGFDSASTFGPNRISLDETLDVGFDTGTPVTEDYATPFDFTGKLEKAAINLQA